MSGLRNGFAQPEPMRDGETFALPSPRRTRKDITEGNGMAELHESIATLLAARGQWRQAYHHLRSALELLPSTNSPQGPEQLRHEVNRLRREHAEAREQSLRDSLTSSYNRRYLDQQLEALVAEHAGSARGFALALVDLDWFKQVNDTYGHLLGDRVLQRVVDLLQESLPPSAFCARYGGEEFVLVMPATDAETSVAVCESARARIEQFPWQEEVARGLRVTVSIGVTHERAPASTESTALTAEQQLLRADALLYAAKRSGRNAVAYRVDSEVRLAGKAAERRGGINNNTVNYG